MLSGNGDKTLDELRDLILHLEERILGLRKPAIGEDEIAALMVNGDKRESRHRKDLDSRLVVHPGKFVR